MPLLKKKAIISIHWTLPLFHMNLFIPSITISLCGNIYAHVIVDDYYIEHVTPHTRGGENCGDVKTNGVKAKLFSKSEFKNIFKKMFGYAAENQSKQNMWKIKRLGRREWHLEFIEVWSKICDLLISPRIIRKFLIMLMSFQVYFQQNNE